MSKRNNSLIHHDEDRAWNRYALEQFFKGYDEADSIYDHL